VYTHEARRLLQTKRDTHLIKQRIEACSYWHGQKAGQPKEWHKFNLFYLYNHGRMNILASILSEKYVKKPPLAIHCTCN
jgi:hypothetical protein